MKEMFLAIVVQFGIVMIIPVILFSLIEVVLCKTIKTTRVAGLIIPIMSGVISLLLAFIICIAYSVFILEPHKIENGVSYDILYGYNWLRFLGMYLIVLLFFNIPTIIYTIIYKKCRKDIVKSSELNKMSIQDLEC